MTRKALRVCDRCGDTTVAPCPIMWGAVAYVSCGTNGEPKCIDFPLRDLCERCYQALIAFMKNEPEPGE